MYMIYIQILFQCILPLSTCSFTITKLEGSVVETSRIHTIKTVPSGSALKCIEECKSLDVSNYPSCSAVQYIDETNQCDLSYVHKSSKPIGYDPTSYDSNSPTKKLFLLPGSELSGTGYFNGMIH